MVSLKLGIITVEKSMQLLLNLKTISYIISWYSGTVSFNNPKFEIHWNIFTCLINDTFEFLCGVTNIWELH